MKDIKALTTIATTTVKDNGPAILTGLACAGVISTGMLSAKGHVRAIEILDKTPWPEDTPFTKKDQIKLTWKAYVPAVTAGSLTIAAIVGSQYLNMKQAGVMAATYAVTEKAFSEYKSKVAEKMPDKVAEIREEIAKDRLTETGSKKLPVVAVSEDEDLCYDVFSGRYFSSTQNELDRCLNMLNQSLVHDSWVSLNTWYSLIGLHNIRIGEEFGWNTDNLVNIHYGSNLTDDGRPCITVSFDIDPRADIYRAHNY